MSWEWYGRGGGLLACLLVDAGVEGVSAGSRKEDEVVIVRTGRRK